MKQEYEGEISSSAFGLIETIQHFLEDYFSDEYEVLKFNINFLESNGFAYQTKVDYMKLNRFIAAAYNTISANDNSVIDGLITKMYKDIIYLNSFYKNCLEKSKDPQTIFRYSFLKSCHGIEGLYHQLHDTNDTKNAPVSDAVLEEFESWVKEEFNIEFRKEFEEYTQQLRLVINTKTYYFDKLLWAEAHKSSSIVEFFKKSKRADGELKDELSTKIFIQQYMQTVDIAHAKDAKWHQYLQNVLSMMD